MRQCLICNSMKTYIRKGSGYEMWHKYNGGWKCQNCYCSEYHKNHAERMRVIKYNSWTRRREHHKQRVKEIKIEKRLKLFDILGKQCVNCGYSADLRALTFDHVRDDGHEERKIHYGAYGFYTFYLRNPDIAKSNLQVLCCNCNNIKKYDLMNFKL